ncbi:MAG: SRPBCC family protein [Betaproteobacteria bacterium]
MEMQATRLLGVTQQQAWLALNDPQVLKLCIPGCDKVEATADSEFDIGMALRIGPVSARFKGHISLSDIVPPSSYRISFEGQGGPAGFGKGQAQVQLAPVGSVCELSYSVTASVGGKVAQLGQRLIDGVARSLAEDFFRRFDEEMQRRHGDTVDAATPATGTGAPALPAVLLPALVSAGLGAAAMLLLLVLVTR